MPVLYLWYSKKLGNPPVLLNPPFFQLTLFYVKSQPSPLLLLLLPCVIPTTDHLVLNIIKVNKSYLWKYVVTTPHPIVSLIKVLICRRGSSEVVRKIPKTSRKQPWWIPSLSFNFINILEHLGTFWNIFSVKYL